MKILKQKNKKDKYTVEIERIIKEEVELSSIDIDNKISYLEKKIESSKNNIKTITGELKTQEKELEEYNKLKSQL